MNGDCCCDSYFQDHGHALRKVLTKAEKVEKLKKYAEELKKELAAVDEHIIELSK